MSVCPEWEGWPSSPSQSKLSHPPLVPGVSLGPTPEGVQEDWCGPAACGIQGRLWQGGKPDPGS